MAKSDQRQRGAQQQTPTDIFKNNLRQGVILGGIAYIIGFVVTFVFTNIDAAESSGIEAPLWKFGGIVFYSAQQVSYEAVITQGGETQTQTYDIFSLASQTTSEGLTSTVPQIVYQLVPVVVLIGAGYYAYQKLQDRSLSTEAAAALGATIVSGYGIMAIIGKFIVTIEQSSSGFSGTVTTTTAGPALIESVIFVGLVYPLIFGAIGGVIANRWMPSP